jgi:hypothetical protein
MIDVTCTNCKAILRVPETAAGKKGKCKNCGSVLTVGSREHAAVALNSQTADCPNTNDVPADYYKPEPMTASPSSSDGRNSANTSSPIPLRSVARKERTNIKALVLMLLKWVTLGISGICFVTLFAETESAPRQAVAVGMACFFGIVSRLMQAEEHAARN